MKFKICFFSFLMMTQFSLNAFAENSQKNAETTGEKIVEAMKKKDIKNDPLKQDVNPAELEKKYSASPKFSSESFDQKDRDAVVEKIEDQSNKRVAANSMKMYSCRNAKDLKALSECKQKHIKSISNSK